MKSVKFGLSLLFVYVLAYTPYLYVIVFTQPISGYFRFKFYINDMANFFIYLFVDEDFRAKLRAMCS